jgi:hypothetical protein
MAVTAAVDVANLALQRLGEPVIASLTGGGRNADVCNQLYAQNRDYCLQLTNWSSLVRREHLNRAGAIAVTGITRAAPPVVSFGASHAYDIGDMVTIDGLTAGMGDLEDGTFVVASASFTTNAIALLDTRLAAVDATAFTAWSAGGTVYRHPTNDWSYVYDPPADSLRVIDLMDEEFGAIPHQLWLQEEDGLIYAKEAFASIRFIRQETDASKYEEDLVELIAARLAWQISMRIRGSDEATERQWIDFQRLMMRAKQMEAINSKGREAPEVEWTSVF